MTVSVIIPTYDRVKALQLTLPYYYRQKYVKEIIIIDDNSSQDYSPLVEKFRSEYDIPLIYIRNEKNLGAGACRNIGLKKATGDMILWGDDDVYLSDDYVEVLSKYAYPGGNRAVCGAIYYDVLPFYDEDKKKEIIQNQKFQSADTQLFDYKTLIGKFNKDVNGIVQIPFGHAILLLERRFYDNVSYYEGYKVNGFREETDAQVLMTENGVGIYYTSETCCYHCPREYTKDSGAHKCNKFDIEIFMERNNAIFIRRHYKFFKEKYGFTGNATLWLSKLVIYRIKLKLNKLFGGKR